MYSLEVQELTKRIGKTVVIDHVRLSLQTGEMLALLGPPDSGKTMLLRLLIGLEEPSCGRVILNGENVTGISVAERDMGLVFQGGYGLIPHMTVAECISLPLRYMMMSKSGMDYRVENMAKSLHISSLLTRKVSSLKGEERFYVALARVLAKDPALYLFDDLLGPLDTPTRLKARRELVEIQQKMGLSCIFTTSDQDDAFAVANRIAVIHQGKIQQIGTRSELVRTPATLWVAQWLDSPPMNTLQGYLQGSYQPEGLCYRVWAGGFTPLLPDKWTRIIDIHKCKEIFVGVRPENIIPEWEFQERWSPCCYTIRAEILSSEWDQGKTLTQLRLPNVEQPLLAVFDISHDSLRAGQIFSVAFHPDDLCLFHPQTQQLLQTPAASSEWNARKKTLFKKPLLSFRNQRRANPSDTLR